MKHSQRYQFQRGDERCTWHIGFPCEHVFTVVSGAIRFWYIEEGELVMPPHDFENSAVCEVVADKPFVVAALKPNTVFFHVWES
jgi:hypothetical protein